MKVNIINEGAKFGLICGLTALLLMFGSWAAGIRIFTSVQFYGTFVPYMIAILLIGGFNLRKQNGGFLSFGEALKFNFLAYAVAAVIIAIATYVLYNIIDKELTQKSAQIALEKTRQIMEKMGSSEEDIEKALKNSAESMKETGLGKIFLGTGLGLIWDFVKALLLSVTIRKEQKFEDQ
ncbi:MAG: DUF4199 domain-containing protein [Sediminibacterium sp.]|nr:DUF4199 domain-containing protein [Sediminibacterium sp.]